MKKVSAALSAAIALLFCASSALEAQQQGDLAYYKKSGKLLGSSRAAFDKESHRMTLYFYDHTGKYLAYGKVSRGDTANSTAVKYYDAKGKALGSSVSACDPATGEAKATYKLATGIVLGTSHTFRDRGGELVTNYYWSNGKMIGYSRTLPVRQSAGAAKPSGQSGKAGK